MVKPTRFAQKIRDAHNDYLLELFSLEKAKLQQLASAFNKHGANLPLSKMKTITGFGNVRNVSISISLSLMVHDFVHHKQMFAADISLLDKKVVNGLHYFLDKLDEHGKDGLDRMHFAYIEINRQSVINRINAKVKLSGITDENDELIGLLPLVEMLMHINREDGEETVQTVRVPMDALDILISTLQQIRADSEREIKNYHKKAHDLLMMTGDA